jgi:hypothetical protein
VAGGGEGERVADGIPAGTEHQRLRQDLRSEGLGARLIVDAGPRHAEPLAAVGGEFDIGDGDRVVQTAGDGLQDTIVPQRVEITLPLQFGFILIDAAGRVDDEGKLKVDRRQIGRGGRPRKAQAQRQQ